MIELCLFKIRLAAVDLAILFLPVEPRVVFGLGGNLLLGGRFINRNHRLLPSTLIAVRTRIASLCGREVTKYGHGSTSVPTLRANKICRIIAQRAIFIEFCRWGEDLAPPVRIIKLL